MARNRWMFDIYQDFFVIFAIRNPVVTQSMLTYHYDNTHAELLILCNLFIGLIENSSAAYIVGSGANLFYGKYNVQYAKKWGFSARC